MEQDIALVCALYSHERTMFHSCQVFHVEIKQSLLVTQLKKVIVSSRQQDYDTRFNFDFSKMKLYMAYKNDIQEERQWLKQEELEAVSTSSLGTTFKLMQDAWILTHEALFGLNFEFYKGAINAIHVLVMTPECGLFQPPSKRYCKMKVQCDSPHARLDTLMNGNVQKMLAFWNALRNIKPLVIQLHKHDVVTLPHHTKLLGLDKLGSKIYIRQCYPKMLKLSLRVINGGLMNLVILGNPGIGKSYFGHLLLLYFAQTNATVVYENGELSKSYLFMNGSVIAGARADFDIILQDSTTYYIVDAIRPAFTNAKTILLTSPDHNTWFRFNKTACTFRYMPVWTWDEISKCRELMYPHLSTQLVETLYDHWGGIARYVLTFAEDTQQQTLLQKALDRVNMKYLVKTFGKSDAEEFKVSHRLLHFKVTKSFNLKHFIFASRYVQESVYNQLYQQNKQHLFQFLATSSDIGPVAVLRGYLFEQHVHSVLPLGGTFRMRRLFECNQQDDGIFNFQLCAAEKVVRCTNDDIIRDASPNIYFQPDAKNYMSVDALITPNLLFQVPCAYPCRQSGLEKVLKLLSRSVTPKLIFALPPDRFGDFKFQKHLNASGHRIEHPTLKQLEQYAMEINLTLDGKKRSKKSSTCG